MAAPAPNFDEIPSIGANRGGHGAHVEFLGEDDKGYQVENRGAGFQRRSVPYCVIRIVRRDEPFLFYKMSRFFDRYGVEPQQSLISTTGNQVVDNFYFRHEDYARLKVSDFEEALINLVDYTV